MKNYPWQYFVKTLPIINTKNHLTTQWKWFLRRFCPHICTIFWLKHFHSPFPAPWKDLLSCNQMETISACVTKRPELRRLLKTRPSSTPTATNTFIFTVNAFQTYVAFAATANCWLRANGKFVVLHKYLAHSFCACQALATCTTVLDLRSPHSEKKKCQLISTLEWKKAVHFPNRARGLY